MRLRLWGTRGSIAVAGAETVRYGGDTAAVEVHCSGGRLVILDAGSGIRPIDAGTDRVDILLSHLHMDHVQGLPFFPPLLDPEVEVHVWGPISTTRTLRERLSRYLSPPLFPVRVRDLANVAFHDVVPGTFELGALEITADLITHPGSTLGYRLQEGGEILAYLPDHEPALGNTALDSTAGWLSGQHLAEGANVLIHDTQYTDEEYRTKVGWGHTAISQLAAFARQTAPRRLVSFHHDPGHTDSDLDAIHSDLHSMMSEGTELVPGTAGLELDV